MRYLLILLLFTCQASAFEIDIIDSRTDNKWTTIVYTKDNGEVCKLNLKKSYLNRGWDIEEWIDEANKTDCRTGESDTGPT